jgi:hypothetical protein
MTRADRLWNAVKFRPLFVAIDVLIVAVALYLEYTTFACFWMGATAESYLLKADIRKAILGKL